MVCEVQEVDFLKEIKFNGKTEDWQLALKFIPLEDFKIGDKHDIFHYS